jgi:hypothetical protein
LRSKVPPTSCSLTALIDTLIQLRQPQLSKKPDGGALSDALSEALPPLSPLGPQHEGFDCRRVEQSCRYSAKVAAARKKRAS